MPVSHRSNTLRTRADFHAANGVLLVVREVPPLPTSSASSLAQPPVVPPDPAEGLEILLAVGNDGRAIALHGHVDLGTGLATALAQIVAEELDLPVDRIDVVLGDTARVPNQGPTIASASIQTHAAPLRAAAAQARAWLLAEAASRRDVPVETFDAREGVVFSRKTGRETGAEPGGKPGGEPGGEPDRASLAYGDLIGSRHVELRLDLATPLKPADQRTLVGTDVPRIDIPAKATGEYLYVHDMRVPGMLHGRVVRPPYVGVDAGDFVGSTLESVDESSIAHIAGVVAVVVEGDFVGVVAEREDAAEAAMHALRVRWKPWPGMRALDDLGAALRANPATSRTLVDRGDVDAATSRASVSMERTYLWPYQLHASIGPSCAVAHWHDDDGDRSAPGLTVWAGTQNPHVLRADLATLMGVPDIAVEVVRLEAAGCYGRNGADDVAADAALMARATGRPVRVQLTREQENLWEPKGAAQLMQVRGGLASDGSPAAYDFTTSYPSNAAPTLALLLTRRIDPVAQAFEMGDRTAVPPYDFANLRVTALDMAPILRASWLRGVSALPNSFAHESYIDELATEAGVDPVDYRLRYLNDPRAAELVRATRERAGWIAHTQPQQQASSDGVLKGQGFAYARYVHSKFPGSGAAWSAWVADVEIDAQSGAVHVSRVVVGHDAGLEINPAGVRHQIHGNVVQTTSRALTEKVALDPLTSLPVSREWGSYPILRFHDVPTIDVMTMPRPGEAPLGVGESSSVPGTAAIANAIFDATGVRFREPPFTPEVVRAGLNPALMSNPAEVGGVKTPRDEDARARASALPTNAAWPARRKGLAATLAAVAGGLITLGGAAVGWRSTIAPVDLAASRIYSPQLIERGRALAAVGNCVGCHTAPGGISNAGGRAIETPLGAVYSTNLTPDPDTGVGRWSFSAFQRAMREGISRDGHFLYPAFPYTAFTRTTDDDLAALYAWLMSRQPVLAEVPKTRLTFPFSARPLMALWNALHLEAGPVSSQARSRADAPDESSALWTRGQYLVDGLGHCGACHTPRSALGAERMGTAYLAGAMADRWEAPPLTALSHAPLPWTENELYRYLRVGHTEQHGGVAGPMIEVVHELNGVPDDDVRAIAHYLASFTTSSTATEAAMTSDARALVQRNAAIATRDPTTRNATQRLFTGACGACHHDGNGPEVFGQNLPLDLDSNLSSARPDNLVRVILDGIREPASRETGFMPAFRNSLDDRQIADLANYLRQRYAPERASWSLRAQDIARLRAGSPRH